MKHLLCLVNQSASVVIFGVS